MSGPNMYPHAYKEKQILKYEGEVYAKVIERLPWDAEMDFSPMYRVKLIRSGMDMVLMQHDLRPADASDLLFNQNLVNLICDCGAKHTVDWNIHSAWCSLTEGMGDTNAGIRSSGR